MSSKVSSCLVVHRKMQVWGIILFDNKMIMAQDFHVRNENLGSFEGTSALITWSVLSEVVVVLYTYMYRHVYIYTHIYNMFS